MNGRAGEGMVDVFGYESQLMGVRGEDGRDIMRLRVVVEP